MAYDAFVQDVPAVILLERILMLQTDAQTEEVKFMWDWVTKFLCAVLTKHNNKSNTVQIPLDFFAERPHKDAKQRGKEWVKQIYPALPQGQGGAPAMSTGNLQELLAMLSTSNRATSTGNPQAALAQEESGDVEDP